MQEMNHSHPEWNGATPPSMEASSDLMFGWQVEIGETNTGQEHVPATHLSETHAPIEAPQEEPLAHFDVTQFDSYVPDPSERAAVDAVNSTIFKAAAEKYSDFAFTTRKGSGISLERWLGPEEYVQAYAYPSGGLYVHSKEEGQWTEHYYSKNNGVWCRESTEVIDDLPKDGEIPTKMREYLIKERQKEQQSTTPKEVGIAEMSHVARLFEGAEPYTVKIYGLLKRINARERSPLKPSDSDAREAAPLFTQTVQRFLRRNGYNPDAVPVTLTGDAINPNHSMTSMQIRVGQKQDETESATPFIELTVDQIRPDGFETLSGQERIHHGGKAQQIILYGIQEDKLQTTSSWCNFDKDGNVVQARPDVVMNGEGEDAMLLAHFLRRPKFSLEP